MRSSRLTGSRQATTAASSAPQSCAITFRIGGRKRSPPPINGQSLMAARKITALPAHAAYVERRKRKPKSGEPRRAALRRRVLYPPQDLNASIEPADPNQRLDTAKPGQSSR